MLVPKDVMVVTPLMRTRLVLRAPILVVAAESIADSIANSIPAIRRY
jgi:hypothetical protein